MIIRFKTWHLDMMRLTSHVKKTADVTEHRHRLDALAELGLVGTVVAGAENPIILGVVGALPIDEKTCEVFIVSAEDRKMHHVEFVKSVRQVLDHIRGHFARIQVIGEEAPFFTRWFSWLGFTREGPASRPGCEGMVMWAMSGRA